MTCFPTETSTCEECSSRRPVGRAVHLENGPLVFAVGVRHHNQQPQRLRHLLPINLVSDSDCSPRQRGQVYTVFPLGSVDRLDAAGMNVNVSAGSTFERRSCEVVEWRNQTPKTRDCHCRHHLFLLHHRKYPRCVL